MRNEGIPSLLNEQILLASNYPSPIFLRFFFFLYTYIFKQRRIVRIIGHSLCRRDTREFCVFYSNLRRSRSKCMKASETREERENASAISIVWFYSCVTECSGRDEEIIYISRAICTNVFCSIFARKIVLLIVCIKKISSLG